MEYWYLFEVFSIALNMHFINFGMALEYFFRALEEHHHQKFPELPLVNHFLPGNKVTAVEQVEAPFNFE